MNLIRNKSNFLFLTILAFIFVSSTALSLSAEPPIIRSFPVVMAQDKVYPPAPILKGTNPFPVLSSQGVLAVDLDSGISLYEKNPDKILLPASTTKIVTALVAIDAYQADQILTVPAFRIEGQKMGVYPGEQFKFEDLLYSLLVYSSNDVAETLAEDYPGGREAFIAAMNNKAHELNMINTQFQNPVGLDGESQLTTARDLVRVSEVAMRNPIFARVVGTKNILITDVTGKSKYSLKNINELLGTVPGVMGVKTGWTENARENLVTYMERDNHKIMIAVLGSQDRFGETKELIDWIFSNYEWREVKPIINGLTWGTQQPSN